MGATAYSGTIIFLLGQSRTEVTISYVPSLTDLRTFANYIHQHSTAKIESITFHITEYLDGLDESEGDFHDLDLKGVFSMKNQSPEPDENPFKQFHLPAPKATLFENKPKIGYRIIQDYGEAVAAAFGAVTQKAYVFRHGAMIGG
jgi:hypothetical protein